MYLYVHLHSIRTIVRTAGTPIRTAYHFPYSPSLPPTHPSAPQHPRLMSSFPSRQKKKKSSSLPKEDIQSPSLRTAALPPPLSISRPLLPAARNRRSSAAWRTRPDETRAQTSRRLGFPGTGESGGGAGSVRWWWWSSHERAKGVRWLIRHVCTGGIITQEEARRGRKGWWGGRETT